MLTRFTHLLSGESLPSQTAENLLGECQRVALILQGGGALGAFQGGVYEALDTAGYLPDWVAGISIGAINAAIIVGNKPEDRLPRLREFWSTVTNDRVWSPGFQEDAGLRRWLNFLSAANTATLGISHFFTPRLAPPWLSAPGRPEAISFYDTGPLRETLVRLVDFNLINTGPVRLSVGAVDVETGNLAFFDSKHRPIGPEHIMASGALPPGFPPVEIDGRLWWDGGIVSNAPLAAILGDEDGINTLCFQVDLFPSRGRKPQSMADVEQRRKEIQYSSRTRLNTDTYRSFYNLNARLAELIRRLPPSVLHDPAVLEFANCNALGKIHLAHLIYRPLAHELDSKDFEFSRTSMQEHWTNGRADTMAGLAKPHWLEPLPLGQGLATYDLTRPEPPPAAAEQDPTPPPGAPGKA